MEKILPPQTDATTFALFLTLPSSMELSAVRTARSQTESSQGQPWVTKFLVIVFNFSYLILLKIAYLHRLKQEFHKDIQPATARAGIRLLYNSYVINCTYVCIWLRNQTYCVDLCPNHERLEFSCWHLDFFWDSVPLIKEAMSRDFFSNFLN